MRIEAVIGANYGDEGKGLFTEYLCRNRPKPLVVLSNGGCQRGHTVNNPETGIRHVFHHFGSGTLLKTVPSVYAKTFLLNPIAYVAEKNELSKLGIPVKAFRAPGCILQLPCDMFVNQMLEKARGQGRHGSCGWGIWETQVRNQWKGRLTFEDFLGMDYQARRQCLLESAEWGFCHRLDDVKSQVDYDIMEELMSDEFCDHFIRDFDDMAKHVKLLETDRLLEVDWGKYELDIKTLVVENGQGLLLDKTYAPKDENGEQSVHATPSKTGLEGAIEAIGETDGFGITANYVTRTYFTRHGAGPFPEHTPGMSFRDETNMPNDYQGSMRFGEMTEEYAVSLLMRVMIDSASHAKFLKERNVVLTHCNEMKPNPGVLNEARFSSDSEFSTEITDYGRK